MSSDDQTNERRPCGTYTAAHRHYTNGEPCPTGACDGLTNEYSRVVGAIHRITARGDTGPAVEALNAEREALLDGTWTVDMRTLVPSASPAELFTAGREDGLDGGECSWPSNPHYLDGWSAGRLIFDGTVDLTALERVGL